VLLIFVGGVFLLQNLGYLPADYWLGLWRLWPLVLVLFGVELLFGARLPTPVVGVLAAAILVGGAIANSGASGPTETASVISPTLTQTLDGASQVAVNVKFDAGELQLGSLGPGSDQLLASASYTGPAALVPQPVYTLSGGLGRLDYASAQRASASVWPLLGTADGSPRLAVNLNPNVRIATLAIKTGASDSRLDLSGLRVADLDLSVGAAATWVRLPAQAADSTTARISGGASSITVEIPPGVAAQIRTRGGLSTVNVNQTRFPRVEDQVFRSPDYETATSRLDLTLDTGVSAIQIN
jgi:hypothetical protein